jgi:hypothetical protein
VNIAANSTPVIDEAEGIIYACACISENGTAAKGRHFLAALKISDGSLAQPLLNLEGAVYSPTDLPSQKFASAQRKQRAGLALTQNHVLIPFGTIAETSSTARGWVLAVDVKRWRLAAAWCSIVTGFGGGIWQSGSLHHHSGPDPRLVETAASLDQALSDVSGACLIVASLVLRCQQNYNNKFK